MRKTVLSLATIIIATVSAFSQSATETRHIKTTALQLYENYKVVMSDLYSKSDYTEENFMALFDNSTLLYNDIVPANTAALLSPARYFENFKTNIKRIYPVFSDFRMDEPISVDNKWQIKCNFTRTTRFRTQKDMNYPEWSFNYVMTIEMDRRYDDNKKVYENAKIISIKVDNPLKGFFVIENKENIPLATKSGETLNDWDKEYNSRIFPEDKWKIYDIKVQESKDNENIFEYSTSRFSQNRTDTHFYHPVFQIFPKNIFGIGINYGLKASRNKTSESNLEYFKANNALSLSVFFGKQIAHEEKSTVFFNVGLDLNRYSYNYSGTKSVKYTTNVDTADKEIDKNTKLLYRTINNINPLNDRKINITSVSIPLSIQYLYQLSQHSKKPVFLSFELGLFAECILPSSCKDSLNADFHGMYNVVFPDGTDQNKDFDHYYNYGDNIHVDRNLKLASQFDCGIMGDVGLWFTLDKSNLLKFDISYKGSFNSLKYNEDYSILNGYERSDQISQPQNAKVLQNIGFGISWVTTIGGKK